MRLWDIQVNSDIPIPRSQKEVRIFLGHVGYYRRFIEKISKLASPLFTLLMKYFQFMWIDACQETFSKIKKRLSTTTILRGPNWDLPFNISFDASDIAIEEVLG